MPSYFFFLNEDKVSYDVLISGLGIFVRCSHLLGFFSNIKGKIFCLIQATFLSTEDFYKLMKYH